jgi:hypothetical protein
MGKGRGIRTPADVLELAAISGWLGEDLLYGSGQCRGLRGVGGGGTSRHYCDPL